MGLIGRMFGAGAARTVGDAVGGVAEVFVGNRAERDAAAASALAAVVGQYGAEFAAGGAGRFDRFVDGLNRLPRPMLALGTLGLFIYAMAAPAGFGTRMQGLALVPEPLWWLLGAIVSFYFGARELHHLRGGAPALARVVTGAVAAAGEPRAPEAETAQPAPTARPASIPAADPDHNPALEEWRRLRS